jgi:hypothetical protein
MFLRSETRKLVPTLCASLPSAVLMFYALLLVPRRLYIKS